MTKRHNFKKMQIWKQEFEIAVSTNKAVKGWPKGERFELTSQALRSAYSVPSNIAEGSAKSSDRDFCRFLEIALGSCYELETQLLLAETLEYGDLPGLKIILEKTSEEQRMINGMIEYLKRGSSK